MYELDVTVSGQCPVISTGVEPCLCKTRFAFRRVLFERNWTLIMTRFCC